MAAGGGGGWDSGSISPTPTPTPVTKAATLDMASVATGAKEFSAFIPVCSRTAKSSTAASVAPTLTSKTQMPVSYTHLDVYKRQGLGGSPLLGGDQRCHDEWHLVLRLRRCQLCWPTLQWYPFRHAAVTCGSLTKRQLASAGQKQTAAPAGVASFLKKIPSTTGISLFGAINAIT